MTTKREQRKAKRAQDFANQKIKKASDFNFDQHNRKDVEGSHVSGQEARFLAKNSSRKDAYNAMQAQKDAGATFGKAAQRKFDRMGARIEERNQVKADKIAARNEARERAKAAKGSTGQETNPIDDTQSGAGDSVTNNGTIVNGNDNQVGDNNTRVDGNDNIVGDNNTRVESGRDSNLGANSGSHTVGDNNSGTVGNNNAVVENNIDNSMEQNIDQDNDQTSTVTGNNNTVIQEADNSIRMYGGDNRTFTYNSTGGGEGQMYDTPGTMATLGGFYDVDDSPAAQAGFTDLYSTLNADNQKRYAGDAMKTFAKYGSIDARDYTPESMDTALGGSIQDSYDKSTVQTGHTFGDIWNPNYITESWKIPSAPSEIKSNAGEIADEAKDDIEDL